VAGGEVLPLAILVVVIGTMIAANAWGIVDGRFAAESAAREASRAYVEAPSSDEASPDAHQAGRSTIAAIGRDPERLELTIRHPDGRPYGRCVPVTVTARYRVPLVPLPGPGGFGESVTVAVTHHERIDPWRSGVDAGGCA
jgi:hypothetical protein